MRKTYFLAPTWNITLDEVVLGSIITNPNLPQKPLSAVAPTTDIPIRQSEETSCPGTAKEATKWGAGLFCAFINAITLGVEVSFSSDWTLQVDYSCECMETRRFTPTLAHITNTVGDTNVRNYLKMGGLGAKVFMITGVKIASNITITTTEEKSKETIGQLGVDMPATGISMGPKVSYSPAKYNTHTRTIEGPIVFAFEIEKVRLNMKGRIVHGEYIDGAMLAQSKRATTDYVIERAREGLDEEEMMDFDFIARSEIDVETGEHYELIMPSA